MSAVPIVNPEQNRLITANTANYAPLRKSGRPPGPIGQHDYITSVRKPGPAEFNPIPRYFPLFVFFYYVTIILLVYLKFGESQAWLVCSDFLPTSC